VRRGRGGRAPAVGYAVGNANGSEAAAGDDDAGGCNEAALDPLNTIEVTDVVLCAGVVPAVHACQLGRRANAEHRREIADRNRDEIVVREFRRFGIGGATDEDPDQASS
jgi:hypothetical protein